MNRKRREKKQAEVTGRVTIDLECGKIGNLVAQYKTRSDFPTVSEHAFNYQLATYATAAAWGNDKIDRLHWGIADKVWYDEAVDLGTEAHRRLEEYCRRDVAWTIMTEPMTNTIADADYAALEARTMAWYHDQWERALQATMYGGAPVVNPVDNKSIEHVDKPESYATSASRITIAKLTNVG